MAYKSAIYDPLGQAGNYILSYICKQEMPNEKYLLVENKGIYKSFYQPDRVEHIYETELKTFIEGNISYE